jgi:hypothetical protein
MLNLIEDIDNQLITTPLQEIGEGHVETLCATSLRFPSLVFQSFIPADCTASGDSVFVEIKN